MVVVIPMLALVALTQSDDSLDESSLLQLGRAAGASAKELGRKTGASAEEPGYSVGEYKPKNHRGMESRPTCPDGVAPVTSAFSCEESARVLGKLFRGEVNLPNYPRGCSDRIKHNRHGGVWWNTATVGDWDQHEGFGGEVALVCFTAPEIEELPGIDGCQDVSGDSGWLTTQRPYTRESCAEQCGPLWPYFTIASGDQNCKCHVTCSKSGHGHKAYLIIPKAPMFGELPGIDGCQDASGDSGWLTTQRPYTREACAEQCGLKWPYFTIASGDQNCKCHVACNSRSGHGHRAYQFIPKAPFTELPGMDGCQDVNGDSGWLTTQRPYTREACAEKCGHQWPYFTIASGDQNCKCHTTCSKSGHGHKAYLIIPKTLFDEMPGIDGCQDVSGDSGWLTTQRPYTPKACAEKCDPEWPYFTIASGDQNCKCHAACSKSGHGHTAYIIPKAQELLGIDGCQDASGDSGWLTTQRPYTRAACAEKCGPQWPYFTIASGDQNCKCHVSCSSRSGHGHRAYQIIAASFTAPEIEELPGIDGCQDASGDSGWLTTQRPYTRAACAEKCGPQWPYFTIASGDQNCKCHVSCSSRSGHGHRAYQIIATR